MERKIYIITIILLILGIIIATGCGGGGDNITTPSSITNPDSNPVSYIATLILNIHWPQGIIPGSFSISSENSEDTLTASMPEDTKKIVVKVLEYANRDNILGRGEADPNDTTISIPVDLKSVVDPNSPMNDPNNPDILPAVKVWVVGEAYDDPNADPDTATPVAVAEKEFQLQVGQHQIDLYLGDYDFTLEAAPEQISVNSQSTITATLSLKYPTPQPSSPVKNKTINFSIPDLNDGELILQSDPSIRGTNISGTTDDTGECRVTLRGDNVSVIPVTAAIPGTSIDETVNVEVINSPYSLELKPDYSTFAVGGNNTIAATAKVIDPNTGTPQPLAGVNVSMSIDPGSTGDVILESPPSDFPTNEDGMTWGGLYGMKPGTVTIKGEYPAPDDPNTIITGSCNVEVVSDVVAYYLEATTSGGMTIPPDFKSDFLSPDNEGSVGVVLWGEQSSGNWFQMDGEEIRFTIISGSGTFTDGSSQVTGITNYQDSCTANLITDSGSPGNRDIVVQAEYAGDPDHPGIPPPSPVTCTVHVADGLVYNVDFNEYSVGTPLFDVAGAEKMGYDWGRANPYDPNQNVADKDIIIGGGYNGNCAQLYTGTYGGSYGSCDVDVGPCYLKGGYKFTSLNYQELRFYVKVGTETLVKGPTLCIGGKWYRGICGLGSWNDYNLLFRTVPTANPDIYGGTSLDCSQQLDIGNFVNDWVEVRIQYLPHLGKICYWYGDTTPRVYEISGPFSANPGFHLSSHGGSVWYDEIRQYDLQNLIVK